MQASEGALAAVLLAAGFTVGWATTGAMLPAPPSSQEETRAVQAVALTHPVVRPVQEAIDQKGMAPIELEKRTVRPQLRRPQVTLAPPGEQPKPEPPQGPQPQPAPTALDDCEAKLRELEANPKSVDKFEHAYAAIKKAAESLPAEKRRAILTTINAANLTGDIDGLKKGLELLRRDAR